MRSSPSWARTLPGRRRTLRLRPASPTSCIEYYRESRPGHPPEKKVAEPRPRGRLRPPAHRATLVHPLCIQTPGSIRDAYRSIFDRSRRGAAVRRIDPLPGTCGTAGRPRPRPRDREPADAGRRLLRKIGGSASRRIGPGASPLGRPRPDASRRRSRRSRRLASTGRALRETLRRLRSPGTTRDRDTSLCRLGEGDDFVRNRRRDGGAPSQKPSSRSDPTPTSPHLLEITRQEHGAEGRLLDAGRCTVGSARAPWGVHRLW